MRNRIVFAIITLLVISCKSKEESSKIEFDYQKAIKESNIKLVKVYDYETKFNKIDPKTKFLTKITEFNKSGYPVTEYKYEKLDFLKEFEYKKEFYYNSKNQLVTTKVFRLNGDLVELIKDYYVGKNNTERIVFYPNNEIKNKVIYEYDSNGNRINYVSYDNLGKVQSKVESKYDDENVEIESIRYNEFGKISYQVKINKLSDFKTNSVYEEFEEEKINRNYSEYYYNKKNQLVKVLVSDDLDKKFKKDSEYKYDNRGFLVEKLDFDKNELLSSVTKFEFEKFANSNNQ